MIPEYLGKLITLTHLELDSNNLLGIFLIQTIDYIVINNMKIVKNYTIGEIPDSMGDLVNMQHLSLKDNLLNGKYFIFLCL